MRLTPNLLTLRDCTKRIAIRDVQEPATSSACVSAVKRRDGYVSWKFLPFLRMNQGHAGEASGWKAVGRENLDDQRSRPRPKDPGHPPAPGRGADINITLLFAHRYMKK